MSVDRAIYIPFYLPTHPPSTSPSTLLPPPPPPPPLSFLMTLSPPCPLSFLLTPFSSILYPSFLTLCSFPLLFCFLRPLLCSTFLLLCTHISSCTLHTHCYKVYSHRHPIPLSIHVTFSHSTPIAYSNTPVNGYLVNLTCDLELPITASREWCMLLNDANCSCNVTRTYSNVTTVGRRLQWNVPKRDIVTFDGTLIGCFVEERLVMAVYARGTGKICVLHCIVCTDVYVCITVHWNGRVHACMPIIASCMYGMQLYDVERFVSKECWKYLFRCMGKVRNG